MTKSKFHEFGDGDDGKTAVITNEDFEDGKMLEDAIHAFHEEKTESRLIDVLEILRDSFVWVPCNAVISDTDREQMDKMIKNAGDDLSTLVGTTFTTNDEMRLVPDILKNGDALFFPVFSNIDAMGEYGKGFSKVQKHFLEAISSARHCDKELEGIVINAFTEPFIIERRLWDVVENLIVPDAANEPQTIAFKLNPSWNKENAGLLTQLGYAFEVGSIFEQDYETAARLYYIAATVGEDSQAMNNYGWLCLNGWGVEKDVQKAKAYFQSAAEMGNPLAMVNLGNIYEFGELGEPDYAQCFEWYKKAADAGDMKGMFNYANCYHWGHGIRKNYKKAFPIFKMLAHRGYRGAAFYVGLYYQEGKGVSKNYELARRYYRIGVLEGDVMCYNQLGVMYAKGLGVKKDAKAALDYYMQAGDMGDALAYTNVAAMYENGNLGEPDLETAKKYYQIAAKQDEPHAIEALQRLGEDN